jgi:hypothetical protein
MKLIKRMKSSVVGLLFAVPMAWADDAVYLTEAEARAAGPDFGIQGEYVGDVRADGRRDLAHGLQVVALGEGRFKFVVHRGGLPGAGWDGEPPQRVDAALEDGKLGFGFGESLEARLDDGGFVVERAGRRAGVLKRIERQSPTLGKEPPAGAVVLFDGTSAEGFERGRLSEDHLLLAGATSRERFGDHSIHLEFLTPFKPNARGQGRGNSGLYVQGRYETQILDSFGLEGKMDEAGGIYSVAAPKLNMCLPPLSWQTYDVHFAAARFDEDGNKTANARMTVYLNGVKVHDDVELPHATTASPLREGPEDGPVFLQDHGNPVRFRNIWVIPGKAAGE